MCIFEIVSCIFILKVINEMCQLQENRRTQYADYIQERITNPRNNIPYIDLEQKTPLSKFTCDIIERRLRKIAQLLHAVNAWRRIDKTVFSHEISQHPPPITREGNKSDILDYWCKSVNLVDGPVLVHIVIPRKSVTSQDYTHRVLFFYILS